MNISIVGAAGEVGRALALHLLRGGLLGSSDRLQLVGHGHEAGERKLLAERADLLDAFDETAPRIEIAGEPEEVTGDVIAIAGGANSRKPTELCSKLSGKRWRIMVPVRNLSSS